MLGTRLVRTALEVLVGLVLGAVLIGALLGQPIGLAFVETGSMQPTLHPGDGFVALPPEVVGELTEGQVVTFVDAEGQLTTHRVVDRTPQRLITKGDDNPLTDQQTGDPPVPRERVVAVAVSVGGDPVVIPGLGDLTTWLRGLFGAAAARVGVAGSPRQIAVAVGAAVVAALVLDEAVEEADDVRSRERRRGRDTGYDTSRLLMAGTVIVVLVATLSMVTAGGTVVVPLDSVAPGGATEGGVVAGTTTTTPVTLGNGGLLPTVAVLETTAPGTGVRDRVVTVPAGGQANATVEVTAPDTPGRYERPVTVSRYVGVLPPGVLAAAHDIHPALGVVAVDVTLAVGLLAVGRLLLGRGRLRLRPGRDVSVSVALRRRVRALYRDTD